MNACVQRCRFHKTPALLPQKKPTNQSQRPYLHLQWWQYMDDIQKINDSLDSIHFRMDKFYAWASQLQVEFRDLKQRIGFIESRTNVDFSFDDACQQDKELLARLDAMKK
jgi:uncharacterized protein (DUF3084 family)